MLAKVLFVLPCAIAIVVCFALPRLQTARPKPPSILDAYPARKFSASEYMKRIDKVNTEISQRKRPAYLITLWWGLDGLRMDENGAAEWIRKPGSEPVLFPTTQNKPVSPRYTVAAGIANHTQSIDSQIRSLQSQIKAVNTQQFIQEQTALLINAIRPVSILTHFTYPCGYYNNTFC